MIIFLLFLQINRFYWVVCWISSITNFYICKPSKPWHDGDNSGGPSGHNGQEDSRWRWLKDYTFGVLQYHAAVIISLANLGTPVIPHSVDQNWWESFLFFGYFYKFLYVFPLQGRLFASGSVCFEHVLACLLWTSHCMEGS